LARTAKWEASKDKLREKQRAKRREHKRDRKARYSHFQRFKD